MSPVLGWRSAMLVAAMVLMACPAFSHAESFYVDPLAGNDSASGAASQPFKTLARAARQVDGVGGEIHLKADAGPYREPLVLRKGGRPENPIIVDGHGATINLGCDVTAGPWEKSGDGYVLLNWPLTRKADVGIFQTCPIFVNGYGIFADHPKGIAHAPRATHGGYAFLDGQGRMGLVFPKGLSPENSITILPGGAESYTSCVMLMNASHITIRHLTVAFAPNDGFNFHGKGDHVLLENVQALFNGDEGISAHETYEIEVRDSEVAFNGSHTGAITDVNDSVSTYKNVRVHQNRAAFGLMGKKHVLNGIVSFGNGGRNLPKPADNATITDCKDMGSVAADTNAPFPLDPAVISNSSTSVEETDRVGRYRALRPANP